MILFQILETRGSVQEFLCWIQI